MCHQNTRANSITIILINEYIDCWYNVSNKKFNLWRIFYESIFLNSFNSSILSFISICFSDQCFNNCFWKNFFFFYQGFLSQTLTIHGVAGEGRGPSFIPLYHFHPRSRTLRHFFQLCMWDDYHVFLIATLLFTRLLIATLLFIRLLLDEIYHLIKLPFDWLIMQCLFVCLLDELILGFCYSAFDMGNRWIWTRIDYHPCITSEATNQVC